MCKNFSVILQNDALFMNLLDKFVKNKDFEEDDYQMENFI